MKYEPSLDGLRAIAIIAVVCFHIWPGAVAGGWAGVDVFFVLSGYLITRILAVDLDATGAIEFSKFYIRRCLRLMPAFALVLMFELAHALMSAGHRKELLEAAAVAALYLMNWSRAFNWLPSSALAHTWSLAMEEQFYILWPVSLAFIRKRSPLVWVLSATALVLAWRCYLVWSGAGSERTYNGFDTHADALLIGCALALASFGPAARKLASRTVFIPAALICAAFALLPNKAAVSQSVGLTLVSLLAAWIVLGAMEKGWLKSVLSLKPLVYTGKISYGWYLWHYPLLVILGTRIHHAKGLIIFVLSYGIAALSHAFVERPFLRLKSRFEPKRAEQARSGDLSKAPASGLGTASAAP